MARIPASGTQHALRAGDYQAVIASVGASLRTLTYQGRDLIVPFHADEVRPSHRGETLAPWPNRVVDGSYSFGGQDYQLPLTEPARGHALHGLATWLEYEAVDKGSSHATLATIISPQLGYPWRILVRTTFALDGDGLTQTVQATNWSDVAAPWGTGPHPYLVAGGGRVDDWTLELPAGHVLAVTDDRLVPIGLRAVDADDPERFDFRTPRAIGRAKIDHAYTDLARNDRGDVTVRLTDASGRGVAMTWGPVCPWVQVHTSDRPGQSSDRTGLALEPMTCAPDAFNRDRYDYDTGLIVIAPGETTQASWRLAAIG